MKRNDATLELISFKIGGDLVAIDVESLVEVLEPTVVSPLPFVPNFIEGLINVNGQIIPQVNLAEFLAAEELADFDVTDDNQTLLVVNLGNSQSVALRVNELQEPISLTTEQSANAFPEDIDLPVTSFDWNSQTLHIFDVAALAYSIHSKQPNVGAEAQPGFLGEVEEKEIVEEQTQEFFIFQAGGYEYALALESVHEIIDIEHVVAQPNSPDILLGIALVREKPRLILNFSALMETETSKPDYHNVSVILVKNQHYSCGIMVDEIVGLEIVSESQACYGDDGSLLSIIRGERQQVTEVISLESLIDKSVLSIIKPFMPTLKNVEEIRIPHVDLLRLSLDGNVFALNINAVKRIVYDKKVEPLLEPHDYLMGTIEFEGSVIPVINLAKRLRFQAAESLSEFIVVVVGESSWALAIERSDQIISVPETAIDKVQQSGSFIAAFASVNGQLLTLLDASMVCADKPAPLVAIN